MPKIIFISGPCGCGKTTFSNLYAAHLATTIGKTVYTIHGDDFQDGFVKPDDKPQTVNWRDILAFNWDCIVSTAELALQRDLNIVIDYIVEDELPRVIELASKHQAELYYLVLTADEEQLERRLNLRGDSDLLERSLFLRNELSTLPENQGHLIDTTNLRPEELVGVVELERYRLI